jgi:RimJ/RimL family protein N-acetyltransferase
MDDLVTGDQVDLRRFRDEDADDLTAACNDELIQRFLPKLPRPYTREDALYWIRTGTANMFAAGGAGYAISDATSNRLLGAAGATQQGGGNAEIGYWVAPWARGQGVATTAARLLAAHAFANGFARLTLRTQRENTPSQRVAIASGFGREGLERGSGSALDGSRFDLVVWARLAGDPDGPTPRSLPDLPGYDGARASGKVTDGVITVRPLAPADAEDTFLLHGVDDVIRTSVPPLAPDFEQIRKRCEHAECVWLAGIRADFTIRDTESGSYAGEIGLLYNEPQLQQALLGYSIAPAWRRRGYATRAVRLVATWVFDHTDIVRLAAGAAPENEASQRVLAAAGFAREGLHPGRLPGLDGSRTDDISYALISPAWRSR